MEANDTRRRMGNCTINNYKRMQKKENSILLLIILCLFLTGCHSKQASLEGTPVKTYTVDEQKNNMVSESDLNKSENDAAEEVHIPEEKESREEKITDEYPYIDYDYIEQYHEILFHNIKVYNRVV